MEDYEESCEECGGLGYIESINHPELSIYCPLCEGNGKIDWIQYITKGKSFSNGCIHRVSCGYLEVNYVKISKGIWKRFEGKL